MSSDLVGATGTVPSKHELPVPIPVKIISVHPTKRCPECGGPWGTIELTENAFITPGLFCKRGEQTDGCLNDIRFDPIRDPWVLRLLGSLVGWRKYLK